MRMPGHAVFVDSAAFIALADAPDRNHSSAERTYNEVMTAGARLVTTNHVIDETCTWLLRNSRNGHRAAVQFGALIRGKALPLVLEMDSTLEPGPHRLIVVHTGPTVERRAWEIFEKYDTSRFSFTDCVSFAAMEALKIKQAFTFDVHYDVMGFERLPAEESTETA